MGQLALAVRWGNPTDTQVTMVVSSLSNAAATVSVTDGATAAAVSWSQVGTSGVYVASVVISSLKPFPHKTTYTITQGGNTLTGIVRPKPRTVDKCELIFNTCDATSITGGDDETGWNNIKTHAQGNPLLYGIVHGDDTGYPDGCEADDSAGTGLTTGGGSPDTVLTVNSYAVAYACHLGLLQDSTYGTTNGVPTILYGQQPARQWCYQNLCFLPQYGDHEFTDNFGYGSSSGYRGDGGAGDAVWNVAIVAYNAFMKPLQGTSAQVVDTGANHWYVDIGPARIVAPDPHYNADNKTSKLLGINQVKDLLTAFDCDQSFKIFANTVGDRQIAASCVGTNNCGLIRFEAQAGYPSSINDEYAYFFDDSGNPEKSIMENTKTNGVAGVFVNLVGDSHHSMVYRSYYTGGTLPHDFYSVFPGTVNGSFNFAIPPSVDSPSEQATYEIEFEYDGGWKSPFSGQPPKYASVLLVIDGSAYPNTLEVQLRDHNWDIGWRKYFAWQVTGNQGQDTTIRYAGLATSGSLD